jgi:hypothetical protein
MDGAPMVNLIRPEDPLGIDGAAPRSRNVTDCAIVVPSGTSTGTGSLNGVQ